MAARKRSAASGIARSQNGSSDNANNLPSAARKNNDADTSNNKQEELSLTQLIPATIVSSLVSVGSYYSCASVDLAEDVVVCTIRTFVQLSFLAALLTPLFRYVEDLSEVSGKLSNNKKRAPFWSRMKAPCLVLGYVFCFMLPLAAYEASARTKLTLRPTDPSSYIINANNKMVLLIVMFSLFTAVSTMGAVVILIIIKPTPLYSPRHIIPLCGMLFNNALSGVSLALDILFGELQSKQRESIELMISFGADAWTATRPSFRSVLASALKPQINSMNVIGLVAIPGMMTGQVLGGASPTRAARYQIIIMCLILGASFIAVGITSELVIWNAFDGRGALRDDWIVDNDSLRVSQLITSLSVMSQMYQGGVGKIDEKMGMQDLEGAESSQVVPVELFIKQKQPDISSQPPLFQVNLDGSFARGKRSISATFTIPSSGEIAILSGPSGIGKSTILKTIAELNSGFTPSATSSSTSVSLSGIDRTHFHPSEWRQNVLYLPQTGASMLQGTPNSFLEFIASSPHNKHSLHPPTVELVESLTSQTTSYLEAWGIQSPQSKLSQSWAKLSGGESQRILLAIGLATGPKILLLDEPTSALDSDTKLKVEESLKKSAENGCAIVLVTHDDDQIERLGTMLMSLTEVSGV